MPARSADSGWPWPDIRWHAPQANRRPGPPATDGGAGGCSSGNQSGGLVFPETLAHSYSLALPGARTMPSGRTAEGCSLSGMLKAHSGSPSGRVSGSCALTTVRSEPSAHTATAMQTDVLDRLIMAVSSLNESRFSRYFLIVRNCEEDNDLCGRRKSRKDAQIFSQGAFGLEKNGRGLPRPFETAPRKVLSQLLSSVVPAFGGT